MNNAEEPFMNISRDSRIAFVLLLFLLIGAFVRLAGGHALISANLTYSSGTTNVLPGIGTPEDTVTSFYGFIGKGLYANAWEISIEPDWTGQATVPYKTEVKPSLASSPAGRKKEHFIKRLNEELGSYGSSLKLNNIQAHRLARGRNDLTAEIVQTLQPEEVYAVQVSGHLLGACSIFQWEKEVTVINIGGEYKVILDGTKQAKSFFYQSWFANIERIADLRK